MRTIRWITALLAFVASHHHYPHVVQGATAYCQSGPVAQQGYSTAPGVVANNEWHLGTQIETKRPVFGRRRFVIRDHIGSGSELDFFTYSCSAALAFGRQTVAYRIVG